MRRQCRILHHPFNAGDPVSARFLMGLDFGGGGGRCLLVDLDSGDITTAFRAWAMDADPANPAVSRIDVERTWALLAEAAREAVASAGAAPDSIAGVAATSMRHASIVLDAEGRELLAASNRDARGLAKIAELAAKHGEELHRRTGHWPNPVQPAGRLCWMAENDPEAFARASAHSSVSDWIAWRLCGELASEPSQAGETLLFDLESREWAWDWVEQLGLPRALFPRVLDAGARLGGVREDVAADFGLRPGTPVAVGGGDTQCGLIGAGVIAPGQTCIVAGTSAPVQQVLERALLDDDARMWSVHHAVPGLWALESNGGGVGEALDWVSALLHPDASHPVLQLLAEAAEAKPGAAGMVSTLGAEVMNARAMGLPVGNLTLSHLAAAGDPKRRHLLSRAIVEGMAFGMRANLEQILATTEVDPNRLHVCGGISRSAFFTQLLSDATGRPVEVAAHEASALGAALCAGVGADVFANLEEATRLLAGPVRRHEPATAPASTYAELYASWSGLCTAQQEANALASGLVVRGMLSAGAGGSASQASAFRPRILVSADMDEAGLAALSEIGDVEYQSYRQAMRLLTGKGLVEALKGFHVFVTEIDVVDAAALLEARDLRAIGVCRGDAVNVDLEACSELGIPVLHTPGRNADAVADLTLAFLLMLARRLPEATAFLREPGGEAGDMGRMGRAFGSLRGHELWQKTVGLVGLGAVGRKVVQRVQAFGAHCLVYDPFLEPDAIRLAGAEPASLDDLLRASDFVSLHAAVTEKSRGLIGERELALMREGACLVNTARAALLDEDALRAALESGHLGGAALDVFAVEPPGADDPLLALPNVVATPHVGGNTAEVAAHQGRIIAGDLDCLRKGEAPHSLLNPGTLERFDWAKPRPEPHPEVAKRLSQGPAPAVSDLQRDEKKKTGGPRKEPEAKASEVEQLAPKEADMEIRNQMERIMAAFVERIVGDAGLGAFAATGQEVTLHFALSDLGLECHFGFHDGAVTGAMGPPDGAAAVELKLKADLFDGMFTGRRNAMESAMNGELSFSGDAAKAMTLTHIQDDLNRLYREVREEVGDPGDLTSIPDPKAGGTAASAPAKATAGDERHELVEVVNELYAAQLITATGGNVSVRTRANADEAWITPSQLFKGARR
jgi:autoinducer 2 (AI-2) kinase